MYFQWAYPKAKIMICLIEIQRINKESWFKNSADINRVMGELMRCGTRSLSMQFLVIIYK